jgi:VanZ family protein
MRDKNRIDPFITKLDFSKFLSFYYSFSPRDENEPEIKNKILELEHFKVPFPL